MTIEADELPGAYAIELHFSSTEEGTEDTLGDNKVIWKDILREGTIAITPGRKKKVPFKVIAKGQTDVQRNIISMTDLIDGYDKKAFEDVTIPDGHPKPNDSALNNTGYVRGLRVIKKKGKHYLQGALGFTEPEVADKVRRGTVPNVSSGIFLGFTRKADDTYFPACINHVALTKSPWINDLEPFKKVFAADDGMADDFEMHVAEFDDEGSQSSSSDDNKAEIVWNEKDGTNWLREALQASLSPEEPDDPTRPYTPRPFYNVQDVSQKNSVALVEEYFKGDRTRWVIPFTMEDDKPKPAPSIRWTEGRDALIAASDDVSGDDNFGDLSVGKITEKLGLALSDMFGEEEGKTFTVEEIALDQRALIRDKNGRVYLADFVPAGARVVLSPAKEWEFKSAPEADAKRPAPATKSADPDSTVVQFHDLDTPEGRVQAARQRRRQMLASSH